MSKVIERRSLLSYKHVFFVLVWQVECVNEGPYVKLDTCRAGDLARSYSQTFQLLTI